MEEKTTKKISKSQYLSHKPIEELNLLDDFLFNELVINPKYGKKFIKYFLETVLSKDIHINEIQAQVVRTGGDPNYRAIRMDVVADYTDLLKLDNNTIANVEMQAQNKYVHINRENDLRKRSRFHQALIDRNLLISGGKFGELKNILIIFCTPFDLFGKNRSKYTFENRCTEELELALEDGARRIFLYTKGIIGDNKELKELLCYVENSNELYVANAELKHIHQMVNDVKNNKEVGERYMLSLEHDWMMREEGREEGREEERLKLLEQISNVLILGYLEQGFSKDTIISQLIKEFKVSSEVAEKYCKMYLPV